MANEIRGIVSEVQPVMVGTTKSGTEYRRQIVVIDYGSIDWPRKLALEIRNEKIAEFNLHKGNKGVFTYSVESRQYQGKWYTTATCYKFESSDQAKVTGNEPESQRLDI